MKTVPNKHTLRRCIIVGTLLCVLVLPRLPIWAQQVKTVSPAGESGVPINGGYVPIVTQNPPIDGPFAPTIQPIKPTTWARHEVEDVTDEAFRIQWDASLYNSGAPTSIRLHFARLNGKELIKNRDWFDANEFAGPQDVPIFFTKLVNQQTGVAEYPVQALKLKSPDVVIIGTDHIDIKFSFKDIYGKQTAPLNDVEMVMLIHMEGLDGNNKPTFSTGSCLIKVKNNNGLKNLP